MIKKILPSGVKVYYSEELHKKNFITAISSKVYKRFGYKEILTPTFEYQDDFKLIKSEDFFNKIYKFVDKDGSLLTLRPDMTIPVAKAVTNLFNDEAFPVRVFYNVNVFRYIQPNAGQFREFFQSGIELIGSDAVSADVEIFIILEEQLKRFNIDNYKIVVGNIGLLNAILSGAKISAGAVKKIVNLLRIKDKYSLKKFLNEKKYNSDLKRNILSLLDINGLSTDIINKILKNIKCENLIYKKFITKFKKFVELLEENKISNKLIFDMALVEDINYYTGTVFEVYSEGFGFSLCRGGRYDNLYKNFGIDKPAIGFAWSVDRLFNVIKTNSDERKSLLLSNNLHQDNKKRIILEKKYDEVILSHFSDFEEEKEFCRKKGITFICYSDKSNREVIEKIT